MIDFRMKTFLTVCECMNFTRAAQVLNLTQPAVSQHIRYLEEQYDTPLFIREKKKLYLTDAGQILKDSLETLQSDDHRMKIRMQQSMAGKKGLTFGVTMTIGEYAVIPSLARFLKAHPYLPAKNPCPQIGRRLPPQIIPGNDCGKCKDCHCP